MVIFVQSNYTTQFVVKLNYFRCVYFLYVRLLITEIGTDQMNTKLNTLKAYRPMLA